jgi:hypothetical protein
MRIFFKIVLALSGILPATYLMFWLVIILVMLLTYGSWDVQKVFFIGLILLAITGYIGLLLVLFEETVKKEKIIGFLLAGVVSFIIFTSISDNWSVIFSMEDQDWFLFTWPTVVAVINIVRLIVKPSDQDLKSFE